jgi:hypothetical protein
MSDGTWSGWFASKIQGIKDAVTPKPAAPLLSDAAATSTLGTAKEAPQTTITGGRRRTRKGRKGRKTRRGHRKH